MDAITRNQKESSLERGMRTETRFFEAMNECSVKDLPPWILGARRPTSSQDKYEGIDAIIETSDVGPLFVQIKSSKAGEEHFMNGRHHQRNKSIIVVVIERLDTPEQIRAKARKSLSNIRWQLLKFQSMVCCKQGS